MKRHVDLWTWLFRRDPSDRITIMDHSCLKESCKLQRLQLNSTNDKMTTYVLAVALLLVAMPFCCLAQMNGPSLIDVPNITIKPQNVEFGLRYKVQGSSVVKTSVSTSRTSNYSVSQTSRQENSRKDTITREISSSMDANASMNKVVTFSFEGKLHTSSNQQTVFSWSDLNTYDEGMDYKSSASETTSKSEEASNSFDANSGFIHAGFSIQNTWGKPITIRELKATIILVDPVDDSQQDAIASANVMRNVNTYQWNTMSGSGGTDDTHSTNPTGTELEVSLLPGKSYVQPLNFEAVNTGQLLLWLSQDRIPKLQLDYKLIVNSSEISPPQELQNALARGVSLLIIDQRGIDKQFYISDNDGTGISALDALRVTGFTPQVATSGSTEYISSLNGKPSDCPPSDLADVVKAKHVPNEGAWVFAVPKEDSFNGGLRDKAPKGTHFVILYMTRGNKLKLMRSLDIKIPVASCPFLVNL